MIEKTLDIILFAFFIVVSAYTFWAIIEVLSK